MNPAESDSETGIFARRSPYLERAVQLGVASGRVISVSFPEEPPAEASESHPLLDRIFDYLGGVEDDFDDVPVALTVPTEYRSVLETVRSLPYGTGRNVATIARMTPGIADDEEGKSIVRDALDANPIPLLIPDHRVRDGPSGAPPVVEQRLRSLENL